jgi:hypothetical protein
MSKYREVLKFLKSPKAKERKMPFMAKITLIAIAKETDRQRTDAISLSDDELTKLVNAELLEYTLEQTKVTTRLFFQKWEKEHALAYISNLCQVLETDMEGACKHIMSTNKKLAELPVKKRQQLKKEAQLEAERAGYPVQ